MRVSTQMLRSSKKISYDHRTIKKPINDSGDEKKNLDLERLNRSKKNEIISLFKLNNLNF